MPESFTICMVNYNGERYLRRSLAAAADNRVRAREILLVDNGSGDASLEIVKQDFPMVRILALPANLGPAGARNAGFRAIRDDWILFLDNDVQVAPDCIEHLLRAARQPGGAVVLPRILYADAPETIQFDGAGCHYTGLMVLHNHNRPLAAADGRVFTSQSLVAACFLLRCELWGEDDPFDESFLFNYEDHDFGLRLRLRGHTILSVPAATAWHMEGTPGLSIRPGGGYAPLRIYCLIRNRWLILLKSFELRTLISTLPILAFFEAAQLLGTLKKGWLRQWVQAACWVLLHLPQIRAERRRIQAGRRVTDREIIQGGPLPFRDELAQGRLEQWARRILDAVAAAYGRWLGLTEPEG